VVSEEKKIFGSDQCIKNVFFKCIANTVRLQTNMHGYEKMQVYHKLPLNPVSANGKKDEYFKLIIFIYFAKPFAIVFAMFLFYFLDL
jgi:hypothetical protein